MVADAQLMAQVHIKLSINGLNGTDSRRLSAGRGLPFRRRKLINIGKAWIGSDQFFY